MCKPHLSGIERPWRFRSLVSHSASLWLLGLASLTACSQSKSDAPSPAPTSTADANTDCTVQLSGNLKSSLTFPSCGELSSAPSEAGLGDFSLNFHFATHGLASLDISIPLGESPSPGSYSSENSGDWSAAGFTHAECRYTAGNASVPNGSFKLTLSEIEIADGGAHSSTPSSTDASTATADAGIDAEAGAEFTEAGANLDAGTDADAGDADVGIEMQPRAGIFHGKLELTMYVLAPPATDCGVGDLESVVVDF